LLELQEDPIHYDDPSYTLFTIPITFELLSKNNLLKSINDIAPFWYPLHC